MDGWDGMGVSVYAVRNTLKHNYLHELPVCQGARAGEILGSVRSLVMVAQCGLVELVTYILYYTTHVSGGDFFGAGGC